jgi:hypothetical protein
MLVRIDPIVRLAEQHCAERLDPRDRALYNLPTHVLEVTIVTRRGVVSWILAGLSGLRVRWISGLG